MFTVQYHVTGNGSNVSDNASELANDDDGESSEMGMRWAMLGLSFLIAATAAGNILVCLAVTWERRLQNMTNYFLMSLAIADLLVSLLVMPPAMIVELFGYFPLGHSLCVIWATMDVLLCTASIWHMCTMSMDRYFTIRYPIRYGRNKTKKMMALKITFVWVASFAVSAPLAIAGFVDYSNVYKDGKCTPEIKNFVLYGSIFAFYVPLIIMLATYTLTIRILRQNRVLMSGPENSKTRPSSTSTSGSRLNSRQGTQRYKEIPRLNGIRPSPPQSGLTITSVGMTSVKCSSAESPASPAAEAVVFNPKSTLSPKRRSELLRTNLADEANYVNCNFEQILRSPSKRHADVYCDSRTRSKSPQILRSDHAISLVRIYNSHPVITRSRSTDLLRDHHQHQHQQSLLLRIPRRNSDTNLALQMNNSSTLLRSISDDQKLNLINRSLFEKNAGGRKRRNPLPLCERSCISVNAQPVDFRLRASSSAENLIKYQYPDFIRPFHYVKRGQQALKQKAPSCQTTVSILEPSPLGAGRFKAISLSSSFLDASICRSGTLIGKNSDDPDLEKQTDFGIKSSDNKLDKSTADILTVRPIQNGSVDVFNKENGDQDEQPLVTTYTDQLYKRQYHESSSRYSPSNDTSPSRSDSRPFLRTRGDLRRNTRVPSACVRKIGLSKSKSTNERKASKVLGIIFAVFVFSWTPFFTMNIVSVVCESCMEKVTESVISSIVWLGYLSSLANPIIYTMFSTSFRTVFYRILTCQYSRNGTNRQSTNERYLCWTKNGRSNEMKSTAGGGGGGV